MTDLFISYTQENYHQAQLLAQALEQEGFSVWWNKDAPKGELFNREADDALHQASCVIVVWSQFSVSDRWINSVARDTSERGILLTALFEDVFIPAEFRDLPTINLIGWKGDPKDTFFQDFVSEINKMISSSGVVSHQESLNNEGDQSQMPLPLSVTPSESVEENNNYYSNPNVEEENTKVEEEALTDAEPEFEEEIPDDPEGKVAHEEYPEGPLTDKNAKVEEGDNIEVNSERLDKNLYDPEEIQSYHIHPKEDTPLEDNPVVGAKAENSMEEFEEELVSDVEAFAENEIDPAEEPDDLDPAHLPESFDIQSDPTKDLVDYTQVSSYQEKDADPEMDLTEILETSEKPRQPKLLLYGGIAAAILLVFWGIFQVLPDDKQPEDQVQTLEAPSSSPASQPPPEKKDPPLENQELIAWESALEDNTIMAFESYKERYPQGAHLDEAQAKIVLLQSNEIPEEPTTPPQSESNIAKNETSSTPRSEGYASVQEGNFFTTKEVTRGPMRPGEPNQEFQVGERVYLWATINSPGYERVKIEWLTANDGIITEKYVNVARDMGNGFNIHDWKQNFPGIKGQFKARLFNGNGEQIAETFFTILGKVDQ